MLKKLTYLILVSIILFSGVLIWRYVEIRKADQAKMLALQNIATSTVPALDTATTTASSTDITVYETALAHNTDMFEEVSVSSGDIVKSKSKVTGEVRGTWYFEGMFPVELRTGTSTVVWQGGAKANSNWMTTNFVPFSVTLNYAPFGTSTPAMLVLKKDNPSGDPINDDELQIPVILQ
jgi:hypothetical protein